MEKGYYNFCPKCGKGWPDNANYCAACGHTKIETEILETDYLSATPITFINFFPRLFSAVENVSLRDFFMMFSTARLLVTKPFSYLTSQAEGKIVPVFTSIMMATFAGTFKCFQDPVYGPMLHKLDMDNEISETIVQFALYLVLASLFGLFAFILAKIGYRLFNLTAVAEDVFIRAMLVLFNVFSFVFDSASPVWMHFVYQGSIPWGLIDLLRGALILAFVPIIYSGLKRGITN
jgi:uncharacterized protein (DUF983 family)